MLRMMAYVAVVTINGELQLSSRALIDNHVDDAETLMRLEWAMMEKNFAFFANGKASGFLVGLGEKVQALIMSTLMGSSQQSSVRK